MRNVIKIWCLIIVTLASSVSFSQSFSPDNLNAPSTKKYLEFGLGMSDLHIRDNYINPRIYNPQGVQLNAGLSVENRDYQQYITAMYSGQNFGWGYNAPDAAQYQVELAYSILFTAFNGNLLGKPFRLGIGPGLSTYFSTTDVFTSSSIDWFGVSDKTWYVQNSLDFHALATIQTNRTDELSFGLTCSAIHFSTRPDPGHNFSSHNNQVRNNFFHAYTNERVNYFPKNMNTSWQAAYSKQFSEKLQITGQVSFSYYSDDQPVQLKMYRVSYLIHFQFSI